MKAQLGCLELPTLGRPPRPPFRLRDPRAFWPAACGNVPGPGVRLPAVPQREAGVSRTGDGAPGHRLLCGCICSLVRLRVFWAVTFREPSHSLLLPAERGEAPQCQGSGPGPARGLCVLENRAACLPYVPPKAGVLPGAQHLPRGRDLARVCTNRLLPPFCHFKDQKEKPKMASALC